MIKIKLPEKLRGIYVIRIVETYEIRLRRFMILDYQNQIIVYQQIINKLKEDVNKKAR